MMGAMPRADIAATLFGALLVLVLASASSLAARPSGLAGHIVFTRAGGAYGDATLFVSNADGTGQRRISRFGVTCCPFATRTGSRIVFAGNAPDGRITGVTANLDGTHRKVLTLPAGTLEVGSGPFSPDGTMIAGEGFDDKHPAAAGVYLRRASDGKILRRLTKTHFIPGDFSPNGKQLVVFKGAEGADDETPPPGALWLVNTSGRGLHRLTPANVRVQCCGNYKWSRDGTKILFADSSGVIWTISPSGSKPTQVFKDAKRRYAVTPTWSPDGAMIMFALDPTPNPFYHPPNGLYVIRADGSGLTKVIGGNNFKREPVWVSG
jgi:Tol biopolymer transport system component